MAANEEEGAPEGAAARRSDLANWAKPVSRLTVSADVPQGGINLNVEGRRQMSPVQGFGQLWQKTHRISLAGVQITPAEVVAEWKANFAKFWPADLASFFGPITGIAPGEVAVLNLNAGGGIKLSTGVLVLYADEESFTFMTPQGHMFAGWITFSSFEQKGTTSVQVQVLIRANDPIYEMGMMSGVVHKKEDVFWQRTLQNLARHFGIEAAGVDTQAVCVDRKRQWGNARNVWHNAAIRSGIYGATKPFRRRKG